MSVKVLYDPNRALSNSLEDKLRELEAAGAPEFNVLREAIKHVAEEERLRELFSDESRPGPAARPLQLHHPLELLYSESLAPVRARAGRVGVAESPPGRRRRLARE